MASSALYDDDYREPVKVDTDGDGVGEDTRKELATIVVPAQVERDREELQRLTASGDVPDSAVGLVVHLRQMEREGLVDANGELAIHKNDRLVKIADRQGNTVNDFSRVQLYCTEVRRLSADVGSTSNCALLMFAEQRAKGRV